MLDQDIIAKDGDGLGKDGVIVVAGGGDDLFIENGVGQDVDKEDLLLSDGKVEEMDRDLIGRGVQD